MKCDVRFRKAEWLKGIELAKRSGIGFDKKFTFRKTSRKAIQNINTQTVKCDIKDVKSIKCCHPKKIALQAFIFLFFLN